MTAALQTKALGRGGGNAHQGAAHPGGGSAACRSSLPWQTARHRCRPLPQGAAASEPDLLPCRRTTRTPRDRHREAARAVQTSVAGCTSQFSFDAASGKVSERPLAASTT
jgi:hypothetical protein